MAHSTCLPSLSTDLSSPWPFGPRAGNTSHLLALGHCFVSVPCDFWNTDGHNERKYCLPHRLYVVWWHALRQALLPGVNYLVLLITLTGWCIGLMPRGSIWDVSLATPMLGLLFSESQPHTFVFLGLPVIYYVFSSTPVFLIQYY